jgi:four helix bundle protein
MKDNILYSKSMAFAIRCVNLYKYLTTEKKEFILSKQLLRSGTSIGANIRESRNAQSPADFISKMWSIALKEADETQYWFELLFHTDYFTEEEYISINTDVDELISMLTSVIKTSKNRIKTNINLELS